MPIDVIEPSPTEVAAARLASFMTATARYASVPDVEIAEAFLAEGGALLAVVRGRSEAASTLRRLADSVESGEGRAAGTA